MTLKVIDLSEVGANLYDYFSWKKSTKIFGLFFPWKKSQSTKEWRKIAQITKKSPLRGKIAPMAQSCHPVTKNHRCNAFFARVCRVTPLYYYLQGKPTGDVIRTSLIQMTSSVAFVIVICLCQVSVLPMKTYLYILEPTQLCLNRFNSTPSLTRGPMVEA
jgi:hypothetical protein